MFSVISDWYDNNKVFVSKAMRPRKKKIMWKELHNKLKPRSSADVLMCILSVMQKIGPCLSVIASKIAETVIVILVVLFWALIYSTMLMINKDE